jgi:hypothetical protein
MGQKEAVVVKKDTVEYNAGSFGTRPNAMSNSAEKTTRVEVDRDGAIRVQGENVSRHFCGWKRVFRGGSGKWRPETYPPTPIDKVQVIDGKSETFSFRVSTMVSATK